jgi:hypothetical protein
LWRRARRSFARPPAPRSSRARRCWSCRAPASWRSTSVYRALLALLHASPQLLAYVVVPTKRTPKRNVMAIPGKDVLTLFLRTKPLALVLCHWKRSEDTRALAAIFTSWLRHAQFGGARAQELVLLPKQDALRDRAPVVLASLAALGEPGSIARAFPHGQDTVCAVAAALAAVALGVSGAQPPPPHALEQARYDLQKQRKQRRTARKTARRTAARAAAAAAAGVACVPSSAFSSASSSDEESDGDA